MKYHKIELIIVDLNQYGVDEFVNSISDDYIVNVVGVVSTDGDFSDDNPLNVRYCTVDDAIKEFNRLISIKE